MAGAPIRRARRQAAAAAGLPPEAAKPPSGSTAREPARREDGVPVGRPIEEGRAPKRVPRTASARARTSAAIGRELLREVAGDGDGYRILFEALLEIATDKSAPASARNAAVHEYFDRTVGRAPEWMPADPGEAHPLLEAARDEAAIVASVVAGLPASHLTEAGLDEMAERRQARRELLPPAAETSATAEVPARPPGAFDLALAEAAAEQAIREEMEARAAELAEAELARRRAERLDLSRKDGRSA